MVLTRAQSTVGLTAIHFNCVSERYVQTSLLTSPALATVLLVLMVTRLVNQQTVDKRNQDGAAQLVNGHDPEADCQLCA